MLLWIIVTSQHQCHGGDPTRCSGAACRALGSDQVGGPAGHYPPDRQRVVCQRRVYRWRGKQRRYSSRVQTVRVRRSAIETAVLSRRNRMLGRSRD
jgi:hypothetical protein